MEQKKFGLIGHPLGHSMSAVMHNAAFKYLNLPYIYELFDILPEQIENFLKNTKLNGLNVTIPYKPQVIPFLDKIDKTAEQMGSVNTIKIENEKTGYTTDGIGCVRAFTSNNITLRDKKIFIIGAGGASRSIIFTLVNEGAELTLSNRTKEKALEIIKEIKDKLNKEVFFAENEDIVEILKKSDILINTTSVGMHPNENEMPIDKKFLHKNLIVMDIVYNPIKTKLLEEADKIGCKTLSGVDMLVYQGAESLRIWLGIEPPIEVMKKAVVDKLNSN